MALSMRLFGQRLQHIRNLGPYFLCRCLWSGIRNNSDIDCHASDVSDADGHQRTVLGRYLPIMPRYHPCLLLAKAEKS